MTSKGPVWVFVADTGLGRLLRCDLTPTGRCHVEETDRIVSQRPDRKTRKITPHVSHSGNHLAGNEEDEELHRFAKETGAWLKLKLKSQGMDRLVVFAPPRFLGALRKERSINGHTPIEKRKADLAHMDPTAIAKHPAIQALVGLDR